MQAIFSFFASFIDHLFPERDTLESYLAGSTSLEEIEFRQQEWERRYGHQVMYR